MKYPEITSLYKYRAFNKNSIQLLINEAVWFSKPSSFNDPFDCGVNIDLQKLDESVQDAVKEVYKQNGICTEQIPVKELKTKDEDRKAFLRFRSDTYNLIQNVGVFSLSNVNNDLLMWAHYADSHRGFCIEFERNPDNILGRDAEPVMYQDDLPSLSATDVSKLGDGVDKLWLTKSTHWLYEEEWRIIYNEGNKAFQFPCLIKSIIFGLKMNENDRYTIQKIMQDRNVVFKEAVKDEKQFIIKIIEVNA